MVGSALLLAAGRGSRMGSGTDEQPKCLTRLAGRPLIDWQTSALAAAGITTIAAIGGYRKDKLAPFVPVAFENPLWAETNMVMTLVCADSELRRGACLVSYSDIVYHPSTVEALAACDGDIAITYDRCWHDLWRLRFEDPLDDAETFRADDGWLSEIGGKAGSLDDIRGQYMGLLKFTPQGWSAVSDLLAALDEPTRRRFDMTSLIRRLLAEGYPVAAVPVDGRWCEVDQDTDVKAYERALDEAQARGARWSHDWRW